MKVYGIKMTRRDRVALKVYNARINKIAGRNVTGKKKEISIEEYNKQMDKIIRMNLPVHETLILMLNFAGMVRIKEKGSR